MFARLVWLLWEKGRGCRRKGLIRARGERKYGGLHRKHSLKACLLTLWVSATVGSVRFFKRWVLEKVFWGDLECNLEGVDGTCPSLSLVP